jgi:hypothetical protein
MDKGRRKGTKLAANSSLHHFLVLVVLASTSSVLYFSCPDFFLHRRHSLSTPHSLNSVASPIFDASLLASPAVSKGDPRPLFPYSIIPRGVGSIQDLRYALAHDPVAAAHYAGFSLARAHFVRAGKSRAGYVSYRLGNRVFWTKNKLPLQQGELLISDGQHTARTRCGNRVSEIPMAPVSPSEPTAEKLNIPLEPFDPSPLWASNSPAPFSPLSPGAPTPPSGPGGGIFIPPVPPIFCCGGGGGSPPPVVPPPPVQTPEPGTLLLLVIGLATAILLRKK